MSLSDTCFEFVDLMKNAQTDDARRKAVVDLQAGVEHYARYPFSYGDEIPTLRQACVEFLYGPTTANADPLQRIIFLADSIRDQLDMHPDWPRVQS